MKTNHTAKLESKVNGIFAEMATLNEQAIGFQEIERLLSEATVTLTTSERKALYKVFVSALANEATAGKVLLLMRARLYSLMN
jgi:hypothetical protein